MVQSWLFVQVRTATRQRMPSKCRSSNLNTKQVFKIIYILLWQVIFVIYASLCRIFCFYFQSCSPLLPVFSKSTCFSRFLNRDIQSCFLTGATFKVKTKSASKQRTYIIKIIMNTYLYNNVYACALLENFLNSVQCFLHLLVLSTERDSKIALTV